MPTDSATRIPFSGNASTVGPRQRLIVALDVSTAANARRIVAAVGDSALTYKVGMQLYTAEGPSIARELVASGRGVFLDLKYHDIPNTVGAAVREAAQLGVSMLTVHASGAGKMLRAAVEAAKSAPEMMILAVTVLTSMDEQELAAIGVSDNMGDEVVRLAVSGLPRGRRISA
jgi:orotidine-5'-phosphate decarboxylase